MANPVSIANSRWNHSMKLGQFAGKSPKKPLHSGHRAPQDRPAPAAAVYTPSKTSTKVIPVAVAAK
jgi:hypothetical protein